ncbi:unnamed protein product [Nippostrongylus brasiliensis]|uniref:Bravo_FIGEY domain-containing protein n=1 Tax=Nippostrongylus brasiliensis TaxID=27835 RepID=A0A0N4YHE1_NIPBR|nr:unnamed protein product [Nippostrongylus brasiliensis]
MREYGGDYKTVTETQREYEDPDYFYGEISSGERDSHSSRPDSSRRIAPRTRTLTIESEEMSVVVLQHPLISQGSQVSEPVVLVNKLSIFRCNTKLFC